MASLPAAASAARGSRRGRITSMKAHAAGLAPLRVLCTVLVAAVLAVGTLHPVNAQAPKLPVAADCPIATSPMNFAPSGTEQCFTVPNGVRQIQAGLVGGSGGFGFNPTAASPAGGNGAAVVAVVDVTPGQVLYVDVGGNGLNGGVFKPPEKGGVGGFNGGGNAGASTAGVNAPPAGGGGGATDIRTAPSAGCAATPVAVASLASRILVAGGGGGGGETNANSAGDNGGFGGAGAGTAEAGENGFFQDSLDGRGGGGATETAAGAGGAAASPGTAGAAGTSGCGGAGGDGTGGGGGGGGYFGGGGGGGGAEGAGGSGAGGGGGGGSSYANPLLTCDATSGAKPLASARTGPRAIIVFPVQTPCPTLVFEPQVSSDGFVVQAVGTGWMPKQPITLTWGEVGSPPADTFVGTVTPATADFTYTIVLMTHDEVGERALIAYQPAAPYSNVAFLLVALAPEEPPTFLFRR
jgi:hypothetical protein